MGFRTYSKYISLFAALAVVAGCLPDESSAISDSNSNVLVSTNPVQTFIEDFATTFTSASQSAQNQIVQSEAFQNGMISPGMVDFAALGVTDLPANMKAAYCETRNVAGAVSAQIVTWMEGEPGGEGFNESVVNQMQNNSVSATLVSNNQAVIGVDGYTQTLNFRSACAGLNVPNGSPVIVSNTVQATDADGLAGTSYEYASNVCPEGQVGSIINRRTALYANENTYSGNRYGPWEPYQNTCMDFIDQSDVGQVSIEVFANEMPGTTQGLGVEDVLNNLEYTECVGTSTFNTDTVGQQGDNNINCGNGTALQTVELLNPLGSDLMMTDEVVAGEGIEEACPAGDLTPFTGYALGYPGQVTMNSTWQGTVEFSRNYNEVIDMAHDGHMDDGLSQLRQWQGSALNCTRSENLTVDCDVVNTGFGGPQYTVNSAGGYIFTRTNEIDGWADPVGFEPNPSLPNDAGWNIQNGDCSWVETQSFDNCPTGYAPLTTGEMRRDINANDVTSLPIEDPWTSVVTSTCERVDVATDNNACAVGETGSIVTTTTYTSTAPLLSSTPTTTNDVVIENNCVPDASVVNTDPVECGPAANTAYPSFPTTGLCGSGSAENQATRNFSDGSTVFFWDCSLPDGTVVAYDCSANELDTAPVTGLVGFNRVPSSGGGGGGSSDGSEWADVDGDGDGDMSIGAAINKGFTGFDRVDSWNGDDGDDRVTSTATGGGGGGGGGGISGALSSIGSAVSNAVSSVASAVSSAVSSVASAVSSFFS